jgi:hypothetical protein
MSCTVVEEMALGNADSGENFLVVESRQRQHSFLSKLQDASGIQLI